MDYEVKVIQHINEDYLIEWQKVYDEDGKKLFSVHNLNDCPEDAIIDRDLFNVGQFLSAVRLGIKLANCGYSDIVVADVETIEEA